MNAIPAARIPHRVGRRTLRHLVEHRIPQAESMAPERASDRSPAPAPRLDFVPSGR